MSLIAAASSSTSALATAGAALDAVFLHARRAGGGAVKVGVLFSLTGGLSIIEKSLHDATMMAISEINAKGASRARRSRPSSRTAPPIRRPTTRKPPSW